MSTTNTTEPKSSWKEYRRFRAWELHRRGWKQRDIAEALGVTPGAVSQWLRRAREGGGVEALRHHPAPGRKPRITEAQKAQIPALLSKGAEYYGFIGQVWTGPRVAAVVKEVYGVSYHETHIRRILRALSWSVQKPIHRASQRDETAIETWRTERWPAIKRGQQKKDEPSSG
jgi:transposase